MISSLGMAALLIAATAEASVRVTLGPDPTVTLPGISPEITIRVENGGPEPVEVWNEFVLRVIRPDGTDELARSGFRGDDPIGSVDGWGDGATLAPGAAVDLYVPQGVAPWFRELYEPGEYLLQIRTPLGSSNTTRMVVTEPKGIDAEVWPIVRSYGGMGNLFSSIALSEIIWRDYPSSKYAFHLLPPVDETDLEAQVEAYARAVALNPNHPVADRHRIFLARAHQAIASRLVGARKLEEALEHADAAREILEPLVDGSRDLYVRKEAKKVLYRNYTKESIERVDRILYGPPLLEVEPVCFSATENGFDVLFLYYRTKRPLDLPVGPQNKFTPGPFDRGQPTHFAHDYRLLPWRLQYEGTPKQLVWHLNGEQIKLSSHEAERKGLPPCPPRDADAEQWWIDLDDEE